MIDLRSDTVTVPSDAMRAAMATALVNDDVIDVDPTVDKLQKRIAEMLGKEAAMYMPSGTMTNQVAVRLHCQPGDEMICDDGCHIFNYEQGGFAQLSQVIANTVSGTNGRMTLAQVVGRLRPDNEHAARTRLLTLENTHNKAGGVILPLDDVRRLCSWARENGLKTHLDGARLFNAVVATGIPAQQWAEHFDTVSVCFSKGLGAPVGSALVGNRDQMKTIRRHRKLFGGAMRQSGIIAAGALYALENNVERLVEDHHHAQIFAQAIAQIPGIQIDPKTVETNIIVFRLSAEFSTAAQFCERAKAAGVWMLPFGPQVVRAVTHLNVERSKIERAGEILRSIA